MRLAEASERSSPRGRRRDLKHSNLRSAGVQRLLGLEQGRRGRDYRRVATLGNGHDSVQVHVTECIRGLAVGC
jgi:hypothetical protein